MKIHSRTISCLLLSMLAAGGSMVQGQFVPGNTDQQAQTVDPQTGEPTSNVTDAVPDVSSAPPLTSDSAPDVAPIDSTTDPATAQELNQFHQNPQPNQFPPEFNVRDVQAEMQALQNALQQDLQMIDARRQRMLDRGEFWGDGSTFEGRIQSPTSRLFPPARDYGYYGSRYSGGYFGYPIWHPNHPNHFRTFGGFDMQGEEQGLNP